MEISFKKIQPFCSRLAKKYTFEDLDELQHVLKDFDQNSFKTLQEYIIFPIQLTLLKEKNGNIIIECTKFLNFVFQTTNIASWKIFWRVLEQIMSFIISTPQNQQDPSEELIQVICECTVSMFLNSEEDILFQLFHVNFSPAIAQYLYTLLKLLKEKKSKSLRLNILDSIAAMLYCHKDLIKTTRVKNKAREIVASFLPGVSIALRDIICGDQKQGYKIFEKALNLLGELVSLTMADNTLTKKAVTYSDNSLPEEYKKLMPNIVRNEVWINKTSSKLKIIFENFSVVLSHNHWKVRFALAKCIEDIFSNCISNLEICTLSLLQNLFALSVDEYTQVAVYSQNIIKCCMMKDKFKSLNVILKEDLDIICSKLIGIHLAINDEQKLFLLKTIHGYFQILGSSINTLLYSFSHLDKFCKTMLKVLQFDTSNIIYLEQNFVSLDLHTNIPKLWPKKCFKYFHNTEIITRIKSIFYVIGYYGDIQLLIDYFLEKIYDLEYKNEALFLITCTMTSLNENKYSDHIFIDSKNKRTYDVDSNLKIELISGIIEVFLDNFEIYNSGNTNEIIRLDSYNVNISQICLMLEGISNFAEILKLDFHPLLMKILCPVMEKAGSSVTVVAESGKLTLYTIALYCKYSSVAELIIQNVDYLINSITIGFCHFLQKSEMSVVLKVALEMAKSDILPLFKDPLNQLLSCLDHNQEKAILVMRILLSVVYAVKQWFEDCPKPKKSKISMDNMNLKTDLLQYHELKTIVNNIDENVNEDPLELTKNVNEDPLELSKNVNEENDEIYDENIEPAFHVKLISDILERCIHYQSSKNLELCILTLSIIDNSILALRNDIDRILPCVHKIWKPLVSRFSDNLIITKKAFETLIIISNECGDFIKSRTMKEIWPKLLNFLRSQENTYRGKKNTPDCYLSNSYKYLLLLLSEIGNLALNLELNEKEFEMLVWSCFPFIKLNQPRMLQRATLKTLECLIQIDPDAFWFHYNEAYGCISNIVPVHSSLFNVHFITSEPNVIIKHNLPI